MLERIHTALGFAQFISQPPDCGSEHGKLGYTQQNIAERGAGFIQNGGRVTRTIEQFWWLATRCDDRDRHTHNAAQLEVDINRLIYSESRPFNMITAHHESGLFHGIISGLKQRPDFLLNCIGFLCYADEFTRQRLTLAIEDFVSFPANVKSFLTRIKLLRVGAILMFGMFGPYSIA